jgi:Cu+-exporting ATPase
MTSRSQTRRLAIAVALILASSWPALAHDGAHEEEVETVEIVLKNSGYEPAQIELAAGKPVRLAFRNEATSTCATSVESEELGIARTTLPKGKTVVVALTPPESGEYTFACAMGMVKGTVVVKG